MDPKGSTLPNNSSSVQERRKHRRVRTRIPCELAVRGQKSSVRIETSDLSPGGCYVEMAFTLPVGTVVELKLWIEGVKIECSGVVATCYPQVGNGIRFVIMTSRDQARIQNYLSNLIQSGA